MPDDFAANTCRQNSMQITEVCRLPKWYRDLRTPQVNLTTKANVNGDC